ncbi:hypothetical protein EMQ25_05220 [Arsenicitalea aurantiaca]|uniref:Polysaccharide chain length determinant N-terminal domain-containing protein n=1 Tax=Arsenicitalea aurantiaca TaxID=1783274 RepID=A0A433XES3_9HYPH|nr:GumC family protein [Arsenicitalea aurantiaca]RUT32556.1 hypothetical protein EMQ25_05220 [Arsenicitalea aurantiaca]
MTDSAPREQDLRIDMPSLLRALLHRAARILFVTAMLMVIAYSLLMFVPRLYESSASLLVGDRTTVFTRSPSETAPQAQGAGADALMSSQIELIRSRDTLMAVIEDLDLRSVPEFTGASASPISLILGLLGRAPEERSLDATVLRNLNDRLTVIRQRDSAVINVYVRSESPVLAADIANAIARTHVERRAGLSLSDTADATAWLEREIAALRTRVSEAETAVANYRIENDLFSGANNTSLLDQQLSEIAAQITAAQERKNTALSRAQLIRGLIQSGQPIDGVPAVRDSVVIQQLSQSKAALQGELAQRSATLLPNHPTVRALFAQIGEIEVQIAEEGRRVAAALEAEARIEETLEASLREDLATAKISASTASQDTVRLAELEREARAQSDLLETYLARYRDAASRTDTGSVVPDVRLVTEAAPSSSPASPRTGMILGAVAFVALAVQIGAVLFGELMSGRALREVRTEFDAESVAIVPAAVGPVDADLPAPIVADGLSPEEANALGAEMTRHWAGLDTGKEGAETISQTLPATTDLEDEGDAGFLEAAAEPEPEPEPALEPTPEPAAAVAAASPVGSPARTNLAHASRNELGNLAADIALGRVRVVVLASLTGAADALEVSRSLVNQTLQRGLSVATIDAASAEASEEAGLTDLTNERASFGDVIHKGANEALGEVPWGRQRAVDRRSMKAATLVEALTDVYEVVLVATGRIGMASTLPLFTGLDCRLVLVIAEDMPDARIEAALDDAASLGFEAAQLVCPPARRARVA